MFRQPSKFKTGRRGLVPALFVLLALYSASAFSQGLPNKIRGYKVHRDKIAINTDASDAEALVVVGDPKLIDAGLTGVTFELPAEIKAIAQSGRVDFLTFHDVRVNGISVEPQEYPHRFEFKKGEPVRLPKPARIFLPVSGIVQAVWTEMRDSRSEWTVTGRVFVFGKFRKFGFYHKRVVPVDVAFSIPNPLR